MENKVLVMFFYFLLISRAVCATKNKSAGYILYETLIEQGYKPHVRPILNTSQPTIVNISLSVIRMIEFTEIHEILTVTAKLKLHWYDDYLTWNPTTYDGIKSISIPQSNVWKPDITLENSVERYRDMGGKHMYVTVTYDGRVQWKPLEILRSTCSVDVTKYPVDLHRCCLYFEVWSHSHGSVKLTNTYEHVAIHPEYEGHPQWSITTSTAEERCIGDDRYVVFCITLKRQSNYLMLNIILPISLLSLLSSCVFLLPVSCGEKASFSVTVFLALCVFLTVVSEQLPNASERVSIFNLFVFIQVVISTVITVTTLVQIRFYHRDDERKVPAWLRYLVISCGHKMTHAQKQDDNDETSIVQTKTPELQQPSENICNVTWRVVANWMDPVMFVGYSLMNILCSIVLTVYSVSA